jgi:hypothetical protein
MAGYEVVHVAVSAPNTPELEIIKKVAALVNRDLYQTRVLLSGGLPRLIAHYPSLEEAESTARNLTNMGISAFVCRNSELRKPSKVFTVHTAEFLSDEVVFRNSGGQTKRIKSIDIFLILKGSLHISAEEEATETKRKINWGATLLAGGIPIYHDVKEKTGDIAVREEPIARLYTRESSDPAVQMSQHSMSYSFLGGRIAPSSAANFNTVIAKLQEWFPRAVFDDRLMKSSSGAPTARASDYLELNCKLLYLYYKTKSELSLF